MKIRTLTLVLTFVSMFVLAQTNSKNDSLNITKTVYTQEKGTMSFGIDAVNSINFLGNMFSQSGNNNFSLNLPNSGQAFLFRYVANENIYYRAIVHLGFSSITDKENIMDEK